jgi:predicted nucleic acid-binding protein
MRKPLLLSTKKQMAAIALLHDLTVVTRHNDDFASTVHAC